MNDYTTSVRIDATPERVFAAVNDVRAWWGPDVVGNTDRPGDIFEYRYRDLHYSKVRITELVPDEKVVWLVLENHLNFVEDQTEWVGTTIRFEIAPVGDRGGQTELRFAHLGLNDGFECFDACSSAWGSLIHSSLPDLVTTGKGHPYI